MIGLVIFIQYSTLQLFQLIYPKYECISSSLQLTRGLFLHNMFIPLSYSFVNCEEVHQGDNVQVLCSFGITGLQVSTRVSHYTGCLVIGENLRYRRDLIFTECPATWCTICLCFAVTIASNWRVYKLNLMVKLFYSFVDIFDSSSRVLIHFVASFMIFF